jgi:hypothetical protein
MLPAKTFLINPATKDFLVKLSEHVGAVANMAAASQPTSCRPLSSRVLSTLYLYLP